jgi:hypothetical protein
VLISRWLRAAYGGIKTARLHENSNISAEWHG